jgi:hypothetical protein
LELLREKRRQNSGKLKGLTSFFERKQGTPPAKAGGAIDREKKYFYRRPMGRPVNH